MALEAPPAFAPPQPTPPNRPRVVELFLGLTVWEAELSLENDTDEILHKVIFETAPVDQPITIYWTNPLDPSSIFEFKIEEQAEYTRELLINEIVTTYTDMWDDLIMVEQIYYAYMERKMVKAVYDRDHKSIRVEFEGDLPCSSLTIGQCATFDAGAVLASEVSVTG
ncbi:hypothetical protein BCR39DRAFT_585827 [Naematelia encephala]|uniref:Uncharacterized protein n=1 Tax=Naematelia encephala TaxID=71784 RepID=A0A1Y2BJD8_9TREE|nr:hypothetical protein BCR39DRAFT_585827 [Naematelia encephala]